MDNKIVSLELSDEQLESVVGGFGINRSFNDNAFGSYNHSGNDNGNNSNNVVTVIKFAHVNDTSINSFNANTVTGGSAINANF